MSLPSEAEACPVSAATYVFVLMNLPLMSLLLCHLCFFSVLLLNFETLLCILYESLLSDAVSSLSFHAFYRVICRAEIKNPFNCVCSKVSQLSYQNHLSFCP